MPAVIDYIPRITLSNLKELIKRQSETDATLCARFTLKGIQYTAVAFLNKNEMLFYWDYEGERHCCPLFGTEQFREGAGLVFPLPLYRA